MAGIYCADIYCNDCVDDIKDRISVELWAKRDSAECPDGTAIADHDSAHDLYVYLEGMDEREYDSGDYPKYCSDDSESDCPEHCGSHDECLNYEEFSDGDRCGYCFGNSLTSDGIEYVKEAVRDGEEGGVAREIWADVYDWIDFDLENDNDDDDE